MATFVRTDWHKYSKLGLRRKKKVSYRKGKGIDNKIRLSIKGKPMKVKIGFKNAQETRGLVKGKVPVYVSSVEDLARVNDNAIAIVANVGNMRKKAIAEAAQKQNILFANFVPETFLKNLSQKISLRKEKRENKKKSKAAREKKTVEKEKKPVEKNDVTASKPSTDKESTEKPDTLPEISKKPEISKNVPKNPPKKSTLTKSAEKKQ